MSRETILVIDDEPVVRELCARILAAEGYQVSTADDGWTGIEQVQQERYDAVLTDIKMPHLDGLEAIQIMRQAVPDLVCVVMTGFSTMDLAIQAIKLGVDEFLVKPFTPQGLIQTVGRALEKVRLRRENIRLQAIVPLFELNQTFLRTVQLQPLMEEIAAVAARETDAHHAILLTGEGPGAPTLSARTVSGAPQACAALTSLVLPRAALLPEPRQQTVTSAGEQTAGSPLLQALGADTLIVTPLVAKEGMLGALVACWVGAATGPRPGAAEFLSVLGGQAAIAIDNARLFESIQKAYQDLKELDRLKSEFINIAAHELRTPIAILMGYASLLQEDASEELREPLHVMVRNAQRLSDLVDNLLDLERLQEGSALVSLASFSAPEVVQGIVADFQPLAASKGLRVVAENEPGLPLLHSDQKKFELIVANLVGNAVKFTPSGGLVAVRTLRGNAQPDALLVEVEDTGIGIAEGQLEMIFEPFYQVEHSLTRKHEGMGLGLSIVKGLATLLNATVSVQSAVGRGSTFRVTLPFAADGHPPSPQPTPPGR
ncbi:MAG: response regulator [Chloroflexi bacterium]|nr:response regulator [Chloroflexota bacterium]